MNDILITNTSLLATPGDGALQENSFIAISEGFISKIGPMADIGDEKAHTILNGRDCLTMPGLTNGHCHAAMTLFRGLADDLELMTWLQEHIFPAEAAHVNPEMVYWCSKLAAAEMLLGGTTLVADSYFHEDHAARAFADSGLRAVAAQGVIDFPAPGVPDPSRNIEAAAEFIDHWQDQNPLVTPAVFAHSPYTCSNKTLERAKELSRDKAVPFHIHLAESQVEQGMIADPLGPSPVKHLDSLGLLDPGTVCVHCVWVDEEDMNILAKRGAGAVICPQSHLKLASGMAPLRSMLDNNIPVALGTDGAASNNSLDLFREMDVCAKLQKIRNLDPVAVPAGEILELATTPAAWLTGKRSGKITPGLPADLIMIDLNKPHLQPFYGPDLLVYSADATDVRNVIVGGTLQVQDGRLTQLDLEETKAMVRELASAL